MWVKGNNIVFCYIIARYITKAKFPTPLRLHKSKLKNNYPAFPVPGIRGLSNLDTVNCEIIIFELSNRIFDSKNFT